MKLEQEQSREPERHQIAGNSRFMSSLAKTIVIAILSVFTSSCDKQIETASENDVTDHKLEIVTENNSIDQQINSVSENDATNHKIEAVKSYDSKKRYYQELRLKISYGNASLAEVRQALTNKDSGYLTNIVHALFAMRWHRGAQHLLYGMWENKTDKYPELAWELISKAPVRIALASTINRSQIVDTKTYQEYIRSFRDDEHEFILAQVVVALGFNGDPEDIDYVKKMAESDKTYVVQSAITSLGLMESKQAQNALIELWDVFKDKPRGRLIAELLQRAYHFEAATELTN